MNRSNTDPQGPMTLAAPIRAHVEELLAAGYTSRAIARFSGVQHRRIVDLLAAEPIDRWGRPARIYRRTASALLAVDVPTAMFVPALGAHRRLRALVRIGYPFEDLADALGTDADLLADLALGRPEVVDAEVAAGLVDLFDRYQATPGPSTEAAEFGRRHRFASPFAWAIDDEDREMFGTGSIDDPDAEPAGLPPANDRQWRAVPPDFPAIVADHRDLGHLDEEIAAAMGVSVEAMGKRLHRAGIPERRRGVDGQRYAAPLYGARYTVRLPWAVAS